MVDSFHRSFLMRESNQKTRKVTYLYLFGRLLSFDLLDLDLFSRLQGLDLRHGLCDAANADLNFWL